MHPKCFGEPLPYSRGSVLAMRVCCGF